MSERRLLWNCVVVALTIAAVAGFSSWVVRASTEAQTKAPRKVVALDKTGGERRPRSVQVDEEQLSRYLARMPVNPGRLLDMQNVLAQARAVLGVEFEATSECSGDICRLDMRLNPRQAKRLERLRVRPDVELHYLLEMRREPHLLVYLTAPGVTFESALRETHASR